MPAGAAGGGLLPLVGRYLTRELLPWLFVASVLFWLGRLLASPVADLSVRELWGWIGLAVAYVIHVRTLNDHADFRRDLANPRKVTSELAQTLGPGRGRRVLGRLALATSVGVVVCAAAAGLRCLVLALVGIALSWLYSAPRPHLKSRPALDALTAVAGGIVILLGGYAVGASPTGFPLPFLAAMALILAAMYLTAQTADVEADAQAGVGGTTTRLGARRTLWVSLAMFGAGQLLIVVMALAGRAPLNREILRWTWPSLAAQSAVMLWLLRVPERALPARAWPHVVATGLVQLPGIAGVMILRSWG